MAQCPRCGEAAAAGWNSCPYCLLRFLSPVPVQSSRMHQFRVVVITLVGVYVLAAIGMAALRIGPQPTPTPQLSLGQPVSVNRDGKVFTVTVESVRESAYPWGATPRVGYGLLSVMVSYKAAHNSEDASYNEWDWNARAAGHGIKTYSGWLESPLGAGDLYADGSASGYVTFEVPTSGEVRAEYRFMSFESPTLELVIRPI